jgi:hypothetical protein
VIKSFLFILVLTSLARAEVPVYVYLPGPLYPEDSYKLLESNIKSGFEFIPCKSLRDLKHKLKENPNALFVSPSPSLSENYYINSYSLGQRSTYLFVSSANYPESLYPTGIISLADKKTTKSLIKSVFSLDSVPNKINKEGYDIPAVKRVLAIQDLMVLMDNNMINTMVISEIEYSLLIDWDKDIRKLYVVLKSDIPVESPCIFFYSYKNAEAEKLKNLISELDQNVLDKLNISKRPNT